MKVKENFEFSENSSMYEAYADVIEKYRGKFKDKGISVYIASPYSIGNKYENMMVQVNMANILLDVGFNPFVPLLTHVLNEEKERGYEDWMSYDSFWLNKCHCLLRLPGTSKGADREVDEAKSDGIPVFYVLEDLINFWKHSKISDRR